MTCGRTERIDSTANSRRASGQSWSSRSDLTIHRRTGSPAPPLRFGLCARDDRKYLVVKERSHRNEGGVGSDTNEAERMIALRPGGCLEANRSASGPEND